MTVLLRVCLTGAALLAPLAAGAADLNTPPYMPPSAHVLVYAPPPCFAVFHRKPGGRGWSLTRNGPEEVPVIHPLRYENGRSLDGRVMSVTTGPGATVVLYDRKNFRKPMFEVAPGSTVDVRPPVADSYRIVCAAPYVPLPPPPVYK